MTKRRCTRRITVKELKKPVWDRYRDGESRESLMAGKLSAVGHQLSASQSPMTDRTCGRRGWQRSWSSCGRRMPG